MRVFASKPTAASRAGKVGRFGVWRFGSFLTTGARRSVSRAAQRLAGSCDVLNAARQADSLVQGHRQGRLDRRLDADEQHVVLLARGARALRVRALLSRVRSFLFVSPIASPSGAQLALQRRLARLCLPGAAGAAQRARHDGSERQVRQAARLRRRHVPQAALRRRRRRDLARRARRRARCRTGDTVKTKSVSNKTLLSCCRGGEHVPAKGRRREGFFSHDSHVRWKTARTHSSFHSKCNSRATSLYR